MFVCMLFYKGKVFLRLQLIHFNKKSIAALKDCRLVQLLWLLFRWTLLEGAMLFLG